MFDHQLTVEIALEKIEKEQRLITTNKAIAEHILMFYPRIYDSEKAPPGKKPKVNVYGEQVWVLKKKLIHWT